MKGVHFPVIYDCQKWKSCELGMKMSMMKVFPILLTFYHKLVLREGIFATIASFTPCVAVRKL